MNQLFGITGSEIAELSDSDLRDLIGLLCEADYRLEGLSTSGITWGGNQDARDGGIDVAIRSSDIPIQSYVSRSTVGFQVKKPSIIPSAIKGEMNPKGDLRLSIKNLINKKGAYIIVSSGSSVSDSALNTRKNKMYEALGHEDPNEDLLLDFFDQNRIASWVRKHPGYIPWVKGKIGKNIFGWQSYGNWSNAPGGLDEEYIIDEELRLHDGVNDSNTCVSIENGIIALRNKLSESGSSVRLTGLSGTGKTRLAQALFDERIAQNPLELTLAIYADMSDSPNPDPKALAEQLIADKVKAILIVDNCPPDLHRRITTICSQLSSSISLLTVEYDVRDDLPEETDVFRLEPASEGLIEKLIKRRYKHISNLDSRSIAEFSGGNSRVAIALANTLAKGETLSTFKDEELFERLFRQRHESNSELLVSAEVCSLLYSFEGTDIDSEDSELKILSTLVNKMVLDLYRDISTLKARDLVQSRGVWRAILPHAIANRLAKRALESLPKKLIVSTFENAPERVLRSFTNRISYIHDCPVAIEIVEEWMGEGGLLGKEIGKLTSLGISMFRNLAPVSPKAALELIEHAANGPDGHEFTSRKNAFYYEFVRILKNLAYDPDLFQRSVRILWRFAISEKLGERTNSTRDVLKSLFFLQLSGTHAPIEDRVKLIEELIDSPMNDENDLGILMLDAALEAWHFNSSGFIKFGARPRDYGYSPKTYKELVNWYSNVIDVVHRLAISDNSMAEKARQTLASKLRGLITRAGMIDKLEGIIMEIHKTRTWQEGWFAIKGILRYDRNKFDAKILDRIINLKNHLKPKNILELTRAYAITKQQRYYTLEDDFDEEEEITNVVTRVRNRTIELGIELANDWGSLDILIPELVSSESMRVYNLGEGLAKGSEDKMRLWDSLRDQLKITADDKRNIRVMLGFLEGCAKIDLELYNSILDDICYTDKFLIQWFPMFQFTSKLEVRGIKRLNDSLENPQVNILTYGNLAYGGTEKDLEDKDLVELLQKISIKEGGSRVVIDILQTRFYRTKEEAKTHSFALVELGFNILANYEFGEQHGGANFDLNHSMGDIAKVCLLSEYGLDSSDEICKNFLKAVSENKIFIENFYHLLESLATGQPFIFLNNFIGEQISKNDYGFHWSRLRDRDYASSIDKISEKDILAWADINATKRYPIISSAIVGFEKNPATKEYDWKPIIYKILTLTSDLSLVLSNLRENVYPSSWSGSLADILQSRLVLFRNLLSHHNSEVRDWAEKVNCDLLKEIPIRKEEERLRNVGRNESFE